MFRFDGESVYKVLDLLIRELENLVAQQVKYTIWKVRIALEKDRMLKFLRIFKGMIVRTIKA
jgi:hypothetical protein